MRNNNHPLYRGWIRKYDFTNKIVLVTGGTGALGKGVF
jgi:FlaA1/EpsC-like NDP-sugar epimerase